jgi:hypothetical protein
MSVQKILKYGRVTQWKYCFNARFTHGELLHCKMSNADIPRYKTPTEIRQIEDRDHDETSVVKLHLTLEGTDIPDLDQDDLVEIKRTILVSDKARPEFQTQIDQVQSYNEEIQNRNKELTQKVDDFIESCCVKFSENSFPQFGTLYVDRERTLKSCCLMELETSPEWFYPKIELVLLVPWNSEIGQKFTQNQDLRA